MSKRAKMSGTHVTRIPEVEVLYRKLQASPEITRFGMGVINPAGGGVVRIKFVDESGCVRVTVRGHQAAQHFRIYTKDAAATRQRVLDVAQELQWRTQ
jgi:hypothetical protein